MSRTVVIVNEEGRLVATKDGDKESNAKYANFAKRLVGESFAGQTPMAALRFGWNGSGKLVIAKGGNYGTWQAGDLVDIQSATVSISGNLKIGNKDLQEIIDDSLKNAFELGIKGKQGEIDVTVSDYEGSDPYAPRKICTIGLGQDVINRIETLEREMHTSIPSSVSFGDGLEVKVEEDLTEASSSGSSDSSDSSSGEDPSFRRNISVRIGSGMKFEGDAGFRAIAVDTVDEPKPPTDPDADKPITAAGVYSFLPTYEIEKIGTRYQLKDVYEKVQEIIEKLTGEQS